MPGITRSWLTRKRSHGERRSEVGSTPSVSRLEPMSPHGGHAMNAMRTLLTVVGCIAVLLIISPGEGGGGGSQAGQVGWASWYGKAHQGQKTASGERFSPSQLTAAHRSLP